MPLRPLSEPLAEIARLELNEEPTRLEESLNLLKEWIRKQPHLNARTDDQWLAAFLRGCKFSAERAKGKIDLYYSLRSTAPDIYSPKYSDPMVPDIIDAGIGLVLPRTVSSATPRVILCRISSFDPDKYTILQIMAVGTIILQISYMEDDNLIVSGLVVVIDFKNTTLNHFSQFTPLTLKKIVTLIQDAAPTRIKAIHFLNTPPYFETFFGILKMLLNEKIKGRIHVHNKSYETFYEHVPRSILPIEYGGTEYCVQDIRDYWKNKHQEYSAWLEEDLTYGTVESKRIGKSNNTTMFGDEGSFRRLELD